jgi:flagellar hook-associated protein 3 FlgL
MRVSTSQIYNIANIGMKQAQNAVVRTEEQIAANKRILSPADDPVAATTILQLKQELARIEQYGKNINLAENSLHLEEATLKSVIPLVQRMQEIAVSAGNTAVVTSADYQAFAAEVDSRIQELLNLQNTRNASGQYVFGGYQGGSVPFSEDGGGNYSYHGDQGQLRLQASATVTVAVTDSGQRLFMDIPSSHNTFTSAPNPANRALPAASISAGQVIDQEEFDKLFPEDLVITFNTPNPDANYTITERHSGKVVVADQPHVPGQAIEVKGIRFHIDGVPNPPTTVMVNGVPTPVPGDSFFVESTNKQGLLTTLSRFSDAMRNVKDNPESKAEVAKIVAQTLTNLENAVTQISSVQGEVGARLNTLESAKDLNLDTELFSKRVLSQLEDLDLAEASTRLKMESLVLTAVQQSFVKVSQMSLFNYL